MMEYWYWSIGATEQGQFSIFFLFGLIREYPVSVILVKWEADLKSVLKK
jgi:hypothetical protein